VAGFSPGKIRDLALHPYVSETLFQLTLNLRVQFGHRKRPAFLLVKERL